MTTGTGLYLLGAYLILAAACATPHINQHGINWAKKSVWVATVSGIAITTVQIGLQIFHIS